MKINCIEGEASCLFFMNQTWKHTKDKYVPLLPTMSSVAFFIWGVYLWRRRKSKRPLMKLNMVFHSSAKFLMNRFLWVKAKICVSFWKGESFTVVYLIAAQASVGGKKP